MPSDCQVRACTLYVPRSGFPSWQTFATKSWQGLRAEQRNILLPRRVDGVGSRAETWRGHVLRFRVGWLAVWMDVVPQIKALLVAPNTLKGPCFQSHNITTPKYIEKCNKGMNERRNNYQRDRERVRVREREREARVSPYVCESSDKPRGRPRPSGSRPSMGRSQLWGSFPQRSCCFGSASLRR